MASPGSEASWAITLPNQFEPFGNILRRGIEAKGDQTQMMYNQMLRQQQKAEQDEWKKLNLIQDLTDLSKHQTGSDVANAIGNTQVSKLLQKYTAAAGSMSPAQLQGEISREMSGVVGAMDGVKQELENGDEQLKLLKQNFPDLDYSKLSKDVRTDILSRRLKNDQEFHNPIEVKPSQLDLSNPDNLSKYVTGNKNMVTSIVDPKGAEAETVLMGKQGDYTKFEGKLPFWKKPNYDRQKFNPEGFYTGKNIPSFETKSTTIPTSSMPSSQGKPFEVVDKDVYDRFAQDGKSNLELIAATRQAFPDYDKFNSTEKEYAKRNVLLGQLKSYDQSQLHPTQNVRPQVTRVNVNAGGGATSGVNTVDVYKEIKDKMASRMSKVKTGSGHWGSEQGLKMNELTPLAQKSILTYANQLAGNVEEDLNDPDKSRKAKYYQDDIYIRQDGDQYYMVDKKTNENIAPLDYTNVNLGAQPGIKEKREVIKVGTKNPATRQSSNKDPLGLGL